MFSGCCIFQLLGRSKYYVFGDWLAFTIVNGPLNKSYNFLVHWLEAFEYTNGKLFVLTYTFYLT
jgi:hypothetical protein